MPSTLRHLLTAPIVALALAGCKGNQPDLPDLTDDPSLERIADCGGLKSYVADVSVQMLLNNYYNSWYRWGVPEAGVDNDASDGGDGGPTDYTTTNVQEEGVDELDIVKTDGQFIYTVQDRALYIVKSWPIAETSLVSELELDGWGQGLFLQGDHLYVFSQVYRYDEQTAETDWLRNWSGTRVQVVDVSDRANPTVTRTIDIEGYMADARLIDGHLYGVMNHWMYLDGGLWQLAQDAGLPEVDWSLEGEALEADIAAKREEAREILTPIVASWAANLETDDLLPRFKDSQQGDDFASLLQCGDLYRPRTLSHYNILSVVHLGEPEAELNTAGVVSDGWTLYASRDNLYVAQTSWWWWWGWGDQEMNTQIHKFNLDSSGEPNYVASGVVNGWLYDQFAMSEWDGHLRVTSTEIDWWWGWWGDEAEADEEPPGNNVNVLRDDGNGRLNTVGSITGIAPGEQIYATRMMGPKGYMVTFEQVDPLFTLDLSDHENPVIKGELKIPGYSAYLHPMGENHLLAVGMAGTEEGQITGLAVNVFDVSDLENPTLVQSFELEDDASTWSWSEALWDHHAFTYHRDVLTIPAYYYTETMEGDEYRWEYFSGAISFNATPAGVSEIGRVDHRDLVEDSECIYSYWYDYDSSVCSDWAWYASLRRTVYIEDNLFTVSNYGIKVTDLNDPTVEHARVLFLPRNP